MKEIKLTQGKVTLVDDEDFEFLNQWKWCAHKEKSNWYAIRSADENGKRILVRMHRLIINVNKNELVDHKDRDGLNNQKYNLRKCNVAQNTCNKRSQRNATSKYLGVSLNINKTKQGDRTYEHRYWLCQVMKDGKKVYYKRFKNEIDAALRYNEIAFEIHGEFANLNLI